MEARVSFFLHLSRTACSSGIPYVFPHIIASTWRHSLRFELRCRSNGFKAYISTTILLREILFVFGKMLYVVTSISKDKRCVTAVGGRAKI